MVGLNKAQDVVRLPEIRALPSRGCVRTMATFNEVVDQDVGYHLGTIFLSDIDNEGAQLIRR